MSSVSANYTLPTVLNSLASTSSSGLAKSASVKAKAASTTSSSSTDSTSIGSTFLSLLATELQNQDPTAPVDSTAMVGQMISLNQLDQLISIEEAVTANSTTTTAAAAKAAGTTASTAALNSTSDSATNSLSPSTAAASSQLPFDPNTMMPIGYAATDATGASINSSINAAPIGFSGSANKTSGGK